MPDRLPFYFCSVLLLRIIELASGQRADRTFGRELNAVPKRPKKTGAEPMLDNAGSADVAKSRMALARAQRRLLPPRLTTQIGARFGCTLRPRPVAVSQNRWMAPPLLSNSSMEELRSPAAVWRRRITAAALHRPET